MEASSDYDPLVQRRKSERQKAMRAGKALLVTKAFTLILLSGVLFFFGILGVVDFFQSPFILQTAGPDDAGYSLLQALSLFAAIFLLPAALAVYVTATTVVAGLPFPPIARSVTLCWMAGSSAYAAVSAYTVWEASNVVQCAIFGCVDGSALPVPQNGPNGLKVAFSVVACLVFGFMALGQLIMALNLALRHCPREQDAFHEPEASRTTGKCFKTGVAFCLVLLISLMWFATMFLPNSWQEFTASGISEYTSWSPGTHGTKHVEVRSAWLVTWLLWVGAVRDSPNFKLFPDLLIFYGFLYLVALLGFAAAVMPPFGRCLKRRICGVGVTFGEAVVILLAAVALAGYTYYWAFQHNWCSSKYDCGKSDYSMSALETSARTLGQVANLLVGLLLLPASRKSLWHSLYGVSWERLMDAHRMLGWLFLGVIVAHGVCWAIVVKDVALLEAPGLPHKRNFTVPIAVWSSFAFLIFIGILGMAPVRKRLFEVFLYAHNMVVGALIILMLIHAPSSWYFLLGGLLFWMADRWLRMVGTSTVHGDVVRVEAQNGWTYLQVDARRWEWAGFCRLRRRKLQHGVAQWMMVSVPGVSAVEAHPFTISSAPGEELLSFHIKEMGKNTFTGRLHTLALTNPSILTSVQLEGPYGDPNMDISGYERVVLVAGGVGITPIMAILRKALADGQHRTCKDIRVLWVVRQKKELEMFFSMPHELQAAIANNWITFSTTVTSERPRPDWKHVFEQLLVGLYEDDGDLNIFAYICGPPSLCSDCKRQAAANHIKYHVESFLATS